MGWVSVPSGFVVKVAHRVLGAGFMRPFLRFRRCCVVHVMVRSSASRVAVRVFSRFGLRGWSVVMWMVVVWFWVGWLGCWGVVW